MIYSVHARMHLHCIFVVILSGRVIDQKLQVAGLAKFALAPGSKPYKMVAYIPGSKVCDFIIKCKYNMDFFCVCIGMQNNIATVCEC